MEKRKHRKGFISILELIIVALVLITTFAVLFPSVSYKSEWEYAQLILRSRDVMMTVDGLGKTYDYSFNGTSFNSFLSTLFFGANSIMWSSTDGVVKNTVRIGCVCTDSQYEALNSWLRGTKVNGRNIEFIIYQCGLTSLPPSDVLLIWGYKDLTSYSSALQDYMSTQGGIVEIMDFTSNVGSVQQNIFGITTGTEWGSNVDALVKPSTGRQLTYETYKSFHQLPYRLKAENDGRITATCSQSNKTGNFNIRGLTRDYWICDGTSIYFDTNGDGREDTGRLYAGDTFTIDGYNFYVSYIDSADEARIEFKNIPEYKFTDFIRAANLQSIIPNNNDYSRVLVYRENVNPQKACGVVLNNASAYRTAWISDFTRAGLDVDDDLKQLIKSLLIWASNKEDVRMVSNLRLGHVTSMINARDADVFELYKFDFGIGYPY